MSRRTMFRARSTAPPPNSSTTTPLAPAGAASSSLLSSSQGQPPTAASGGGSSFSRNSQRGGGLGGGGKLVGALRSGCARFVLVAAIAGLSWMVFVGRPSSNGARTLHDGRVHLLLSDPHDQGSTARQDQPGWLTQECRRAVDKLETANIRLVAFDFDMTIVNVHTGGQWMGGANELARHVGPDFSCYIAHCLDRGLKVSVATFSTQKELISKVLHLSVPTDARGQARTIPVFGGNDYLPEFENGKQSQLMLSIQHFAQQAEGGGDGELVREGEADSEGESKAFLDPSQTLLVDDDVRNIQVARSDGYATLHYRPDMTPLYEAELTTSAS